MSLVIQADDLWKQYRLGQIGRGTLQRDLESWWAKLRGREDPNFRYARGQALPQRHQGDSSFWALRGVSFEVKSGEVVGIIGRNGAGKSTLLKILSRVTAPSRGEIRIKGRIASLLEVGTGFHPDLSGRENVFLNGAILGMRKTEIAQKLDSIVDFSGCSEFIDTPVKRYSSGMQVRLAFAVAAHLDAEILVIDEVLAVGDADFQRKCLGKMNEVAGSGRTVLFVSHNMGLITSLCQRAILLADGAIEMDDTASKAVLGYYTRNAGEANEEDFTKRRMRVGDSRATLLRARMENLQGEAVREIDLREPVRIKMWYRLNEAMSPPPVPNLHVHSDAGHCAFVSAGHDQEGVTSAAGEYLAECIIPQKLLNSGTYFLGLGLTYRHNGFQHGFFEKDVLCLNVIEPVEETLTEHRCGWAGAMPGAMRPWLEWRFDRQC